MQDERPESSVSQAREVLLSEDQRSIAAGVPANSSIGEDKGGEQQAGRREVLLAESTASAALPGVAGPLDIGYAWSAAATTTPDSSGAIPTAGITAGPSTSQSAKANDKAKGAPVAPADPATEAPIAVGNPYRRSNSRHAKPKGILKPAPPPQAKFSFRRDVLGYVVGESTPLATQNLVDAPHNPSYGVQPSTPLERVVSNQTHDSTHTNQAKTPLESAQASSGLHQGYTHTKPGGGLWRKLGGAVTAVAGSMPVPQSAMKTLNSMAAAVRPLHPTEASGHDSPSSDSNSADSPRNAPSQLASGADSSKADYIKSVRFTMSSLSVVYPINGPGPPGVEALTRKRINKEYLERQEYRDKEGGWTTLDLLDLYEECCRTREEPGIASLRTMLMSTSSLPKVIDLRDVPLTHGSAAVLSDLLSIDFGLRKLILDNCGLDDESIKMIIHGLLVSGSLPSLSLANNKRIRSKGWRIIAYYIRRSTHLKYLDLSDNVIDKKMADYLGEAIAHCAVHQVTVPSEEMAEHISPGRSSRISAKSTQSTLQDVGNSSGSKEGEASDQDEPDPFANRHAPLLLSKNASTSSLTSLRLENCSLRNPVLESLANSVRNSGLKHISLRRNRINQLGAVALAVLIRDYELSTNGAATSSAFAPTQSSSETANSGQGRAPVHMLSPLLEGSGFRPYSTDSSNSMTATSHPPDHPVTKEQDYGRLRAATPDLSDMCSPSSSSSMSVSEAEDHETSFGPDRNQGRVSVSQREASRYAEMRTRLQRQIEVLPRVGTLLTLDIRSNDIKGGVTYISQVLKRNRTLRVLNLSDNKIEPAGLVALSEALKYNTTLETLDLSNNPCCGPSLDGLRALRTALVLNSSLMRVFLNATGFESAGAIALAEYLPDMQSVIHLDLTDNPDLNIAGIMALAASIKLNRTLRCLDLSIPPNNAEFARLSQDILQSCVRNTEMAQEKSAARGSKSGIATPIFKSELARDLKEYEKQSRLASSVRLPEYLEPLADSARHCIEVLSTVLPRDEELARTGEPLLGRYKVRGLRDQALAVQLQMLETSKAMQASAERQAIEAWSAHLATLMQRATNLYGLENHTDAPLRLLTADMGDSSLLSPHSPIRSPASPSQQMSSPSFSITDSDGSECESSGDEADDGADIFSQGANPKDAPEQKAHSPDAIHVSPKRTPRPRSLELPRRTSPNSSPRSPVENHSRNLTLEEGEVFRRGSSKIGEDDERTLLDVLDGKKEIAGDELKQEILETAVERPRRLSISLEEEGGSQA